MRTLIDTNVLISYLLSRDPTATATWIIIQAAIDGHVTLLLAPGVAAELVRKVASDPHLRRRIPMGAAEDLVAYLARVAEIVPALPEPFPKIVRDRDDDFLIAHCVLARADYLVTWDKDLLVLIELDGIRMVTPPAFLAILRDAEEL